jgi:hypothetical protein
MISEFKQKLNVLQIASSFLLAMTSLRIMPWRYEAISYFKLFLVPQITPISAEKICNYLRNQRGT